MKIAKIYFLFDPRNDAIRYVGKTVQSLSARLRAHCNERSKCHRCNWIAELRRDGLEPGIELIEEVRGDWPWQESERFWISLFKRRGARLTNNTSGGDGVPNLPPETQARLRKVWVGRKHKPESLIRIGNASRGRVRSEASKQRMRELMTGRVITWGNKISRNVRKLSDCQVAWIRLRLAAGEPSASIAPDFKVHKATINNIRKGAYCWGTKEAEVPVDFIETVEPPPMPVETKPKTKRKKAA